MVCHQASEPFDKTTSLYMLCSHITTKHTVLIYTGARAHDAIGAGRGSEVRCGRGAPRPRPRRLITSRSSSRTACPSHGGSCAPPWPRPPSRSPGRPRRRIVIGAACALGGQRSRSLLSQGQTVDCTPRLVTPQDSSMESSMAEFLTR